MHNEKGGSIWDPTSDSRRTSLTGMTGLSGFSANSATYFDPPLISNEQQRQTQIEQEQQNDLVTCSDFDIPGGVLNKSS